MEVAMSRQILRADLNDLQRAFRSVGSKRKVQQVEALRGEIAALRQEIIEFREMGHNAIDEIRAQLQNLVWALQVYIQSLPKTDKSGWGLAIAEKLRGLRR